MIKRFLICGDRHLDSRPRKSRYDNYMLTGLEELSETLRIARAAQVDYFIDLGDVFDQIDVGGDCRNKAIEILRADENGVPWPFKKYSTIGNHDIAHDPAKLKKSSLQALFSAGVMELADTIDDLPIRFFHFRPDLDEDLRNGILENYNEKIMFMHASIVEKPMMFDHVLLDDLKVHKDTKVIVSGHIHRRIEAEKNGMKFFNPGSVGRPKISSDYEKTKVGVLYLAYNFATDEYKTKILELKTSLPYDVVFNLEANREQKSTNKSTERFIEKLTETSSSGDMTSNVTEDLKSFSDKRKINKEVVDMAINAINIIKAGGEL